MSELNNELTNNFIEEFQDEETRHIYTEEFLNSKIATQIKALREQRGWTQSELAEKAGMKQERISALEDVNYSAWTLNVLRRLAKAFDLRIDLNFADFGSFLNEFANFNRNSLERKSFKDDLAYKSKEDKNTNQRFTVIKPIRKSVATNTTPELPFQNLELVWSQTNTTNTKRKSSYTLPAEEKTEDISSTQINYYVATANR